MLIQIKSQAGSYSISMHMVKSSSFKENREVGIKYKFFFFFFFTSGMVLGSFIKLSVAWYSLTIIT